MNHDDILCGSIPLDPSKRKDLLEIAKGRAKGSFQMRDLHNAEKLYSRCIELAQPTEVDRHLLYSNRAAVRLLKGQFQLALDDCEACMDLGAAFIKAHFRKCQALVGLERFEDAISACKASLALHPNNKDLVEIEKTAHEKWEKFKSKPVEEKAFDEYRPVNKVEPASKAAKGGEESGKSKREEDVNEMRGYKKTADGKTTSYFHTELDEEAKKLIGDCKPKPISQAADGGQGTKSNSTGSAWNQAGTFEERDYTTWFSDKVKGDVKGKFSVGDGRSCSFSVSTVTGSAQITSSRGKVRYIHDSVIDVRWKFPTNQDHTEYCKGTLNLESDGAGGWDVNDFVVKEGSGLGGAKEVINKQLKGEGSALRKHVLDKLGAVEAAFKEVNPFAK
eukprot:g5169.t1